MKSIGYRFHLKVLKTNIIALPAANSGSVDSSGTLEKEWSRNIELMWLLKGLAPDHNTISVIVVRHLTNRKSPDDLSLLILTLLKILFFLNIFSKKTFPS